VGGDRKTLQDPEYTLELNNVPPSVVTVYAYAWYTEPYVTEKVLFPGLIGLSEPSLMYP